MPRIVEGNASYIRGIRVFISQDGNLSDVRKIRPIRIERQNEPLATGFAQREKVFQTAAFAVAQRWPVPPAPLPRGR